MTLSETPWLTESEGVKVDNNLIIDLFDPKKVSKLEEKTIKSIASYQNSDGGFAWFKGGRSSAYMTLYLLDALAEAANQDVEVPQKMTSRAMKYVMDDVDSYIRNTKDIGSGQIVMSLYAAYVLTSFPADWAETKTALAKAKDWIAYASKYQQFMTPLGKIYAANVYHRLGDKKMADYFLDQVIDIMKENPTTGIYFTPEEKSWLWYSDSIDKHALTLRTIIRMRPQDSKRIDGMTKWLLFNRKGNTWDNTRSAASAIYALLDVMKAKGAFTTDSTYTVSWNGLEDKQTFKPFDFVKKPLRYTKTAPKVADADARATITKSGPTVDFASLTAVYSTTADVKESAAGLMNVGKKYFLRHKEGDVYKLKELRSGDTVSVGDEIEVQLTIKTSSQFEYVLIKDPKPAGFEADTLLSGWKWEMLSRYEEPRDSLTNFFVDWLPHGEYVLKYRIRPTLAGEYKVSAAQMQSMYAPEFAAHSSSFTIKVF